MDSAIPPFLANTSLSDVDKAFDDWIYATKYRTRIAREDAWNNLRATMNLYHQGDREQKKFVEDYINKKRHAAFS